MFNRQVMRRFLLIFLLFVAGVPGDLWAGEHERAGLADFVKARPAAGAVLKDIPEISAFLLKAFAGEYTSVPLDWSGEEPQGNAYAENTPNDINTFIRIRVSSKLSPEDQVAALVYECRNAQNEKLFAQHIRDAYLGSLGKEDFIREILRLEHQKMKETRAFLTAIPFFKNLDATRTEFYRKMLGTPDGFEEFIAYLHRIKRPEYDVFDMYSRFYDFLTVTPQKRKAELDAKARQEALSPGANPPVGPSGPPPSPQPSPPAEGENKPGKP